jgi:putative sigma-54 modulation protein
MQVMITGRHVEVTAALRRYIETRMRRLERYGAKLGAVQVVLGVEKYRQTSEVILNLNGAVIQAKTSTKDLYASIDRLCDKVSSQVRKHKEKLVSHKPARPSALPPPARVRETRAKPAGLKTVRPSLQRLTLAEAVESLGGQPAAMLVFVNAAADRLQVLRRLDNGVLELIDPQPA